MGEFRHDINALRALAITAVVLFHYGFCLPGGFAGVDVFFVVSGYLMTAIIWSRLQAGSFDLVGFYAARGRRIIPALAVLCAALAAFGLVWLDPLTLTELGRETWAALLFYSNVQFWTQSGYFDAVADVKPLLQTWSLGVEWQFYLVWPVVLMLLHRLFPKAARHLILAGAGLSFALAVVVSTRRPDFGFYLLPTRAWEMALGGLPYLYGVGDRLPARWRPALAWTGLGVVVASALLVDASLSWPAWATLAPTLGTALVITADHRSSRVFRQPAVAALGRWSYSIYLWHWPTLVLLAYFDVTAPLVRTAVLIPVLAVSAFSYRFVERVGLDWMRFRHPRVAVGAACAFAAMLAASVATTATSGFATRFGGDPRHMAEVTAANADWAEPSQCHGLIQQSRLQGCTLGYGPRKVMLLGDSYAEQLYPRVAKLAEADPDLSVRIVTRGGCPPMPGIDLVKAGSRCALFNRLAQEEALSGHYAVVVIASVWEPYFRTDDEPVGGVGSICFEADGECLRPGDRAALQAGFQAGFDRLGAFVSALQAGGARAVLVLPTPFPRDGARDVALDVIRSAFLRLDMRDTDHIDLADFRRRTAYVDGRLAEIAARTGAVLFDPAPSLCSATSCPKLSPDGIPLYKDSAHLRSSVVASARFDGLDRAITVPAAAP